MTPITHANGRTKMNGLYFTEECSWDQTLPAYLQDILFSSDSFGARYCQLREEAKSNLHSDSNKIRCYLGTYFPRSFCESHNVHTLLLGLDPIRHEWLNKTELNVLDFGSGTGGNLFGLLHALTGIGIRAKIHVYSIEGNTEALSRQADLLEHVRKHSGIRIEFHRILKVFPNEPSAFACEFRDVIDVLPQQFDLIMAWKSLSELFIADQTSIRGSYGHFLEACGPRLSCDGVISMLDVTIKSRGRWLPTVMSQELSRYMRQHDDIELIMPFGCAQKQGPCSPAGCYPKFNFPVVHRQCAHDRTKFSYFAMGRSDLASSIRDIIPDAMPCPEECGRNQTPRPVPPLRLMEIR